MAALHRDELSSSRKVILNESMLEVHCRRRIDWKKIKIEIGMGKYK